MPGPLPETDRRAGKAAVVPSGRLNLRAADGPARPRHAPTFDRQPGGCPECVSRGTTERCRAAIGDPPARAGASHAATPPPAPHRLPLGPGPTEPSFVGRREPRPRRAQVAIHPGWYLCRKAMVRGVAFHLEPGAAAPQPFGEQRKPAPTPFRPSGSRKQLGGDGGGSTWNPGRQRRSRSVNPVRIRPGPHRRASRGIAGLESCRVRESPRHGRLSASVLPGGRVEYQVTTSVTTSDPGFLQIAWIVHLPVPSTGHGSGTGALSYCTSSMSRPASWSMPAVVPPRSPP